MGTECKGLSRGAVRAGRIVVLDRHELHSNGNDPAATQDGQRSDSAAAEQIFSDLSYVVFTDWSAWRTDVAARPK